MAYEGIQRIISLEADADGKTIVPDKIHILSAGDWKTTTLGKFKITPTDLADMVINFENGKGQQVAGSKKLPINFGHDKGGKAAGWMTRLFLDNNGNELWADVRWTPSGRQALEDGDFSYISPEWHIPSHPWRNPENESELVANVVTGAGLTNIPLFKKLQPLMASTDVGGSDKSNQKGGSMDLAKLRTKKASDLTEDEKTYLSEHKSELTEDERKTLGLEEQPKPADDKPADDKPKDEPTAEEKQAQELQASINAGTHVVLEATAYKALSGKVEKMEAKLAEYERKDVRDSLNAHIARGAIKSDEAEKWTDKIMADPSLASLVASLPDNKTVVNGNMGDGGDGVANAASAVTTRANELMASTEKLTFRDALDRIRQENPDLYAQYQSEVTGGTQ